MGIRKRVRYNTVCGLMIRITECVVLKKKDCLECIVFACSCPRTQPSWKSSMRTGSSVSTPPSNWQLEIMEIFKNWNQIVVVPLSFNFDISKNFRIVLKCELIARKEGKLKITLKGMKERTLNILKKVLPWFYTHLYVFLLSASDR